MFRLLFISLIFICSTISLQAQKLDYVLVGINGLTCSQCSRSVEMQLRKLSFIKDIEMDLKATVAKVYLHDNRNWDWYAFPKAVQDAGFSIRNLYLVFEEELEGEKQCFTYKNTQFSRINKDNSKRFLLYNIYFMNKKDYRKSNYIRPKCAGHNDFLLIPHKK